MGQSAGFDVGSRISNRMAPWASSSLIGVGSRNFSLNIPSCATWIAPQLLLPKDWAPPSGPVIKSDIALLSNTHEELRLRGMVIVGTPVGSFDFCQWFVKKNLSTMMQESQTLKDLHPQCAVKLLKECVRSEEHTSELQ